METNKSTERPPKTTKNTGFLNEKGKLKVRTLDVLDVMAVEINKHFHQTETNKCKGETEINAHKWEGSAANTTYMTPQECVQKREGSQLQKYFNSQEDRYLENKLTDAFSYIEVYKAIKALNSRKAVGSEETSGEIWKDNIDCLATFAVHILNQCAEIYRMPKA